MTDRPVLVTGAAGFVGRHLVDRLSRHGEQVVGGFRPGGTAPAVTAPSSTVEWTPLDVLDDGAMRRTIARLKPGAIVHLAGAAHAGRSWTHTVDTLQTNVIGTHRLFEAIREADLETRVLVPGTSMVYKPAGDPIGEDHPIGPDSPYGLSKLAQEMLATRAAAGRRRVLLPRAFNHIGPGQQAGFALSGFARQIALIEAGRMRPIIEVGNLDARRDIIDVRDTVAAYVCLLERGESGKVYNVCSGQAKSIGELLDRLLLMAGTAVEVRVDPSRLRPADAPVVVGRPDRLRALGWTPLIPIDRTLRDLLDYWRATIAGR